MHSNFKKSLSIFLIVLFFAVAVQAACGTLKISQLTCSNTPGAPSACSCTGTSYCAFNVYDGQSGVVFPYIPNQLASSDLTIKVNGQFVKTIAGSSTDYVSLQVNTPSTGAGTSTQTTWQIEGDDHSNNCWTTSISAYTTYGPSPAQQQAIQSAQQQQAAQAAQQQQAQVTQAAQQSSSSSISSANQAIKQATTSQTSAQIIVTQAGSTCSAAQASWASANSQLTDAINRYNAALSKYNSGDNTGSQTDASAARSSAVQAQSNFNGASSAAQSCISQAQQAAAQKQQEIQVATTAVTSAQTQISSVDSLAGLASDLKVSSTDGASLLSAAKDSITLAQASLNSGDTAGAQSNAALASQKATQAGTAYQTLVKTEVSNRLNAQKSRLNSIKQKIATYSLQQNTQDQESSIQQIEIYLSQGNYLGAIQSYNQAIAKIDTLQNTVDSATNQIDSARNQQMMILGIVGFIIIAGLVYYFFIRKPAQVKSHANMKKHNAESKDNNVCGNCATENAPNAKHCHECGKKLN